MLKNLRLLASTKILDFVEGLPRFRKGTISSLQDIRERQKRISDKTHKNRVVPSGVDIELNQVVLTVIFEREQFDTIQTGIKRLFPKEDKIEKFIKDFKESQDNLFATSWYNLGQVSKSHQFFTPTPHAIDDLPANIEYVQLSFHRLIPSVACVIFEAKISPDFSKKLRNIQKCKFLDTVIFKRFWPINKIPHSYSMGGGRGKGFELLSDEKNKIRKNLETWIKGRLKWKSNILNSVSYIDVFSIKGNPTESDETEKWLKGSDVWLQDFGITIRGFDTYISENFVLSLSRTDDNKFSADVVTKIEGKKDEENNEWFDLSVRSLALSNSLFCVVDKFRINLISLRASGLKDLNKNSRKILKKSSTIQRLKRMIIFLSRFDHEIADNKPWISHSISEIGSLKEIMNGKVFDLGKWSVINLKYQLSQIKEAANIINTGLTDYLSVQNIYVMYKLQKWIFRLTIVAVFVAVIGMISSWDKLKPLIVDLIKCITM